LPELIGQMLQSQPAPPRQEMPDAARAAILRAIDSAPQQRFESAAAMMAAIPH